MSKIGNGVEAGRADVTLKQIKQTKLKTKTTIEAARENGTAKERLEIWKGKIARQNEQIRALKEGKQGAKKSGLKNPLSKWPEQFQAVRDEFGNAQKLKTKAIIQHATDDSTEYTASEATDYDRILFVKADYDCDDVSAVGEDGVLIAAGEVAPVQNLVYVSVGTSEGRQKEPSGTQNIYLQIVEQMIEGLVVVEDCFKAHLYDFVAFPPWKQLRSLLPTKEGADAFKFLQDEIKLLEDKLQQHRQKAKEQEEEQKKETTLNEKKVTFSTDILKEREEAVKQQQKIDARAALVKVIRFKNQAKGEQNQKQKEAAQAALVKVIRFKNKVKADMKDEAMRAYREKMKQANNRPKDRLKHQAAAQQQLQSMVQSGQEVSQCLLCNGGFITTVCTKNVNKKKLFCDHCYSTCKDACTELRLHYVHVEGRNQATKL